MSTEYVVITETQFYGPKTTHAIDRDENGKQLPVFDSLEEAQASVADQSGPMYLGHNEASVHTSVWEVIREIDPDDHSDWSRGLEDAIDDILEELGIDLEDSEAISRLEIDLPREAAQRTGFCIVNEETDNRWLLCKPISEDCPQNRNAPRFP